MKITRNPTREVLVGDLKLGNGNRIAVQSMSATKTQDIPATLNQISLLQEHNADIIRVAVDSKADVEAIKEIRSKTSARIVIDLQENYRLIEQVAPYVQKVRYNPGHLHHHEKEVPVIEKVKKIVATAKQYQLALRIGVNFGSLDPEQKSAHEDHLEVALSSARQHVAYLEDLGFTNYVVSLKSSNPNDVIDINKQFAKEFPFIPLHLGVTEAGLLPMGEVKTRIAFEQLLGAGIGDTIRASLTLPFEKKYEEVVIGRKIIADVEAGRFRSVPRFEQTGMNIISCPSCSRVENTAFVDLAEKIREMSQFAASQKLTIAVMGCRVNGPGESDDADIGLWCAPRHVNLKIRGELKGAFKYDEIVPIVKNEINLLISQNNTSS